MLVSAACHFTALIVLGLIAVGGSRGLQGSKITLDLSKGGEPPPSTAIDSTPLDAGSAIDSKSPTADVADVSKSEPVVVQNAATDLSSARTSAASDLNIEAPDVSSISASSAVFGGSAIAAEMLGKSASGSGKGRGGGGNGDGSSSKAATEFFGIGGYGQTFVYVVDCSGSMNDNDKFDRARYELLKSIEQLDKDQQYYVIFYNHTMYPMEPQKPLFATQDNLAKSTEWINRCEPMGGTNPMPALLLALSMKPDAIYFLTDGQFDLGVMQELRNRDRTNLKLNTHVVPIHTICFYDRSAEGMMKMIARNSGGEYRYVN
jgi:Mg-chelatase subunit ChlD